MQYFIFSASFYVLFFLYIMFTVRLIKVAINRAVEAIAKGQNRILLVMATGTGKTYTALQINGTMKQKN